MNEKRSWATRTLTSFHTIYDAENRLISVDNDTTASYVYDQNNRRVKKTIGSSVTHCVWEGSKVIAEYNGSTGTVIAESVYLGSRMIAQFTSGSTRYYLNDRISERLVLDANGNVIGRQSHLPFGEELNTTGTTDKHRFTSYERDTENGTDYAVNRQYNHGIGRFNRVDPDSGSYKTNAPQTLNRYSYTMNNPVNFTDRLGLNVENPNSSYSTCRPYRETGFYEGQPVGIIATWECSDYSANPAGDSSGESSFIDFDAIIKVAIRNTEIVLKGESSCSRFFGGSEKALEVLSKFGPQLRHGFIDTQDTTTGIRMRGNLGLRIGSTGVRYRLFSEVIVNEDGPFFRLLSGQTNSSGRRLPNIGTFKPGSPGAQVLAILHELAHLILDSKDKPLIVDDGGDIDKSGKNTKIVEDQCGTVIKSKIPNWDDDPKW